MEVWREISGVDRCEISNLGKVRSQRNAIPRILKTKILPNGYERVNISNGKTRYYEYIHRLVAKAFIPCSDYKLWVNHVDGNKLNNHVDNLEWVTPSENDKHAFRQGLNKIHKHQKDAFIARTRAILAKKILQIALDGTIVRVWHNACDAQKELGFDRANIATAARKGLVRYGFRWRYAN
ncbi:MAG: HNH endonuclease [Negativicutes bacterium]|nr:HNH endonuclease [Negativicutes bacterium]